ncbi:hypothetical protein S7711_01595 [Stachybotrys chartarum IBT 7711]|uniref:Glucose-methanol-choline oxidoreductase N-terminal domain-containing protein n=1 Tax=Stachybotrys chartarum (strain CBS 109288 / IBT 7711) TaxID=1280523 RepID=A0A084BC65_STACB|nr:hypothetical protein S7711_01595 [Stachybotrys chartarum IBT 7711]
MWPFSIFPERSPADVNGKTYDYVIVGGGTAGCVLASRLSQDPSVSVLLLEKGRVQDSIISRIPLMSQNLGMGEGLQVQDNRWTETMPGANGRRNQLYGGESIGGGSRINAMLWTRGPPADFASWAEMGFDGWSWDKVEPYFRKLENAVAHPESKSRGHDGPIELRRIEFPFQWNSFLEKAARKIGLPIEKDCNDPEAPAIGYFPLDVATNSRGERVSAFTAFLNKELALQRQDRLTVCTGVVASRLEVGSRRGLVTGVELKPARGKGDAQRNFVNATREVIICSGAICSPQLLLLSGIGPKTSGDEIGIPLIKELPAVGATFSDHYSFPIMLELPKKETLHILESIWGLWYIIIWLLFRTGLLSTSATSTSVFFRTTAIDENMQVKARDADGTDNLDASKSRNTPDVEIMLMPINSLERGASGHSVFSFYPTLVQPHGKGRIEISSRDPLAHPRITYPMFVDNRDLVSARKAVRFTMRLAEEFQNSGYPHPAPFSFAPGNKPDILKEYEKVARTDYDGRRVGTLAFTTTGIEAFCEKMHVEVKPSNNKSWRDVTDDEIDDYVRRVAHTSLHYSCTCPMSNDDKTGVVDQKLLVHGFKDLRIADASIFPKITSGHTMAPVMMIAARCADFIKETWQLDISDDLNP